MIIKNIVSTLLSIVLGPFSILTDLFGLLEAPKFYFTWVKDIFPYFECLRYIIPLEELIPLFLCIVGLIVIRVIIAFIRMLFGKVIPIW